jgi:oligopeptide transport system ATP-binding protein
MPSSAVSAPLLEVRNLCVTFGKFEAVTDVSFDLIAGETVGLVGESGSGKSTLARALARLIPAVRGIVRWQGVDLMTCDSARLRRERRHLQMVFQDPLASLDPRMTVGAILAEPLEIFEPALSSKERLGRTREMLERVGLASGTIDRYPHEFSGGQCQRIGIARAMMLRPKLLICDEPVSSLDVSIQGQIVNLLLDLRDEFGTAMLFISHNLAVVRQVSDRVLVIYRGRIVELADRDALFATPLHPYTRALLAAVPDPAGAYASAVPGANEAPDADVKLGADRGAGSDELRPDAQTATGCAFRNRCAYAFAACEQSAPVLEQAAPQHAVACHRRGEVVYSC